MVSVFATNLPHAASPILIYTNLHFGFNVRLNSTFSRNPYLIPPLCEFWADNPHSSSHSLPQSWASPLAGPLIASRFVTTTFQGP